MRSPAPQKKLFPLTAAALAVATLLALCWSAHAGPAVWTNGLWWIETDTNAPAGATSGKAGGGAINTNFTFLFNAATNATAQGWTNIVYVAIRTDGRTGSGTATDPYDGSTAQRFSALWSNAVNGTWFILGPGTFKKYADNGSQGFRPRVRVTGAGEWLTTIQLDADSWTTNSPYFVAGQANILLSVESDGEAAEPVYVGAQLENVCLDANWQNLPDSRTNYAHSALQVFGHNFYARNVRVVNTADHQGNGIECFPVSIQGSNFVVERMVFSNHWANTNGQSGHTIAQGNRPGVWRDCVIDLRSSTHSQGAPEYSHAFGVLSGSTFENVKIYGRPDGRTEAFYCDVLTANDVNILFAEAKGVSAGLVLNGVPSTNLNLLFSRFTLSTNSGLHHAAILDHVGGVTWDGWRVMGNDVQVETPLLGTFGFFISSGSTTWKNSTLLGNRIKHGLRARLGGDSTNVWCFDNRTDLGGYVTNETTGNLITFNAGELRLNNSMSSDLYVKSDTFFRTGNYGTSIGRFGPNSDSGMGLSVTYKGNYGGVESIFVGRAQGTNTLGTVLMTPNPDRNEQHLIAYFPSAIPSTGNDSITSKTYSVVFTTNTLNPSIGPVAATFRGDGTLTVTNSVQQSSYTARTNHTQAIRLAIDDSVSYWPVIRSGISGSSRAFVTIGRQDQPTNLFYTADGYNGSSIKRAVAAGGYFAWSTSSTDATSGEGASIRSGSGSPEGVVTANVGSLFLRTDGGAGTTLYVKESGTGNTGWVAK